MLQLASLTVGRHGCDWMMEINAPVMSINAPTVIKDFKNPQNILTTRTTDDITRLYKFNNFGSSPFPSVFVPHSGNLRKLWHERFGHLNYHLLQQLSKENILIGLPIV